MKLFPWKKQKDFFTSHERQQIIDAVKLAEMRTSGEVRVYIESRCRFVDAMDRAKEIFFELQMDRTEEQNATLIYVALEDHQVAVLGDEGIHQKVGQKYWEDEVRKMVEYFKQNHVVDGICQCIEDIGEALHTHFPYDNKTDRNELPDDIVFGK